MPPGDWQNLEIKYRINRSMGKTTGGDRQIILPPNGGKLHSNFLKATNYSTIAYISRRYIHTRTHDYLQGKGCLQTLLLN